MNDLGVATLLMAATDTTMSASLRDQIDALRQAVSIWRDQLIGYRCSLPLEKIRKIRGTMAGWNCRDVNMIVEHLSFTDLAPETARELNEVPTRLTLKASQVDMLVAAGRQVVTGNDRLVTAIAEIRKYSALLDKQLGLQR